MTPRATRLSPTAAFAVPAAIVGLALFASATPSPLYAVYQARWHFSTPMLTVIYATYAVGVLVALLLVGGLSDQLGRRPVLRWSLVGLLASMVLFLLADSVAWLLLARAVQGLATGAALGAAGAAMIDLHPRSDASHTGLVNGVVSTLGIGFGSIASALLVALAPDPRVIPFLVVGALIVAALAGVALLPESVLAPAERRLRPSRPAIPPSTRSAFGLASLGVIASWSIGGLFLSLAPVVAGTLLHTRSALAGGLALATLTLPAGAAQLIAHRRANRTLAAFGASALSVGMLGIVGGVLAGSVALFFAAAVLTGVGFGLAFMGALRNLSGVIPPARRGEVMSAFYLVAYTAISVPAVAAGVALPHAGLNDTITVFGFAVAVVGFLVARGALRLGRESAPVERELDGLVRGA
jgi:predicted MFS family arabinose efflux permease